MVETILRVQIIIICLILLAVSYGATSWKPLIRITGKSHTLRLYHQFIAVTMVMLVTDVLSWLLDGKEGFGVRVSLMVVHTVYYVVHTLPLVFYILYADGQINRSYDRKKKLKKPLYAYWAVIAAMALASPFTGWFFRIGQDNVYTRGDLFIIFALTQFALVGYSYVPVFLSKKRICNSRIMWTLSVFPLLATIGGIVQFIFYGVVSIWPVTTIFLVAAALNIQRAQIGIDPLTGLSNRMSFEEALERHTRPELTQKTVGCILLDLDGFKKINDTLGHDIGDRALEDTAEILKQAEGHEVLAARYGGDEFVLLMTQADEHQLNAAAAAVQDAVEAFNRRSRRPYTLSVSCGYALYRPEMHEKSSDFMAAVDAAMYAHKRSKYGRTLG